MPFTKPLNALLYAVKQYPSVGRTQIVKFPFLVDLVAYNQLGTTILDDTYIRMPHGPVSSYAFNKTDGLECYIEKHLGCKILTYPNGQIKYHYSLKKEPDLNQFSLYETYIFTKILKAISKRHATDISDYTHELKLWKEGEELGIIPIEQFFLNHTEANTLSEYGFSNISQEQQFTREIYMFAKKISSTNSLEIVEINKKLDTFLDKFPVEFDKIYYDVYLAWDDVFRLLVKECRPLASEVGRLFCENYCIVTNEYKNSEYKDIVKIAKSDYRLKIEEMYNYLLSETSKNTLKDEVLDKALIELMQSSRKSLYRTYDTNVLC